MEATAMKNEVMFKEYMTTIGELFDKPVTSLLTTLYWKVLEPFTDEECEQAFKEILFSAKFFPKPVEFLEILKGKESDQATQAWIKTVNTIRRIGPYQSVSFDDSTIHDVIQFMGGWPTAGDWMEDELKWKQREFERLYGIMSNRGSSVKYLPGIVEMENNKNGHGAGNEIIRIGHAPERQLRIAGGKA
jgi:hypothetical protein